MPESHSRPQRNARGGLALGRALCRAPENSSGRTARGDLERLSPPWRRWRLLNAEHWEQDGLPQTRFAGGLRPTLQHSRVSWPWAPIWMTCLLRGLFDNNVRVGLLFGR